jgi:uncharacterized membrane protein
MMWMMVWMTLFWIIVVGGGLWVLLSWRRNTDGGDALEVLRARLARGDIDVREFEQREAALRRANKSTVRGPLIAVSSSRSLSSS